MCFIAKFNGLNMAFCMRIHGALLIGFAKGSLTYVKQGRLYSQSRVFADFFNVYVVVEGFTRDGKLRPHNNTELLHVNDKDKSLR